MDQRLRMYLLKGTDHLKTRTLSRLRSIQPIQMSMKPMAQELSLLEDARLHRTETEHNLQEAVG